MDDGDHDSFAQHPADQLSKGLHQGPSAHELHCMAGLKRWWQFVAPVRDGMDPKPIAVPICGDLD